MTMLEQIFYSLGIAVFSIQLAIFLLILVLALVLYLQYRRWRKRMERVMPFIFLAKTATWLMKYLSKRK